MPASRMPSIFLTLETSGGGSAGSSGSSLAALPVQLGNDLPGGIFSVAEIGVEIFSLGAAVLGGDAHEILIGNFLQADALLARFLFEQAAADVGGLLALVEIDPLADLAAGAGGLHKGEPIAAGAVAGLRDDLDDVAIGEANGAAAPSVH